MFACGLALLIAASGMLLSTSGALAAHQGAVLVKDIRPGHSGAIQGPNGAGESVPQLANDDGTLYLSADDGRHGHELWRSDGSRRGTRMVKDINPGPASGLFQITPFAPGTPFYLFADDGVHGAELWRSDGTAAGTIMVKDLTPGPGAGRDGVHSLTNVNGTLYFGVCTCIQAPPTPGLWRSDGTEAGTARVKQIIDISSLTDVNGTLYFGGAGDDPTFKIGLWRSDGTTGGTTNIKEGVVPNEITGVNGTVYFAVNDGSLTGLWRSDGTEAGTQMVKAIIDAGGGRALPQDLTDVNGTLYFLGASGMHLEDTSELWRSDGTEAGTTQVKRINVQAALGGPGIDHDLTAFKGNLYFTAGGELWRSDGTPRGTTSIKGNCSPKAGARTRCFFFGGGLTATGANGTLYFVGSDKRHGQELWRSDGTRKGTRMVRNIRPGSASSLPMYLTAVNRTLFFTAKDGKHGRELWRAGPAPCAKGKCKKG